MKHFQQADVKFILNHARNLWGEFNSIFYHTSIDLLELNSHARKHSWEYGVFCGYLWAHNYNTSEDLSVAKQIEFASGISNFKNTLINLMDNDANEKDYYDEVLQSYSSTPSSSWESGFFFGVEEYWRNNMDTDAPFENQCRLITPNTCAYCSKCTTCVSYKLDGNCSEYEPQNCQNCAFYDNCQHGHSYKFFCKDWSEKSCDDNKLKTEPAMNQNLKDINAIIEREFVNLNEQQKQLLGSVLSILDKNDLLVKKPKLTLNQIFNSIPKDKIQDVQLNTVDKERIIAFNNLLMVAEYVNAGKSHDGNYRSYIYIDDSKIKIGTVYNTFHSGCVWFVNKESAQQAIHILGVKNIAKAYGVSDITEVTYDDDDN